MKRIWNRSDYIMAMKNPYNYTMPKAAIKFKTDTATATQNTSQTSYNNSPRTGMDQYKEQSILTARPEELTLMLYNGIIKFANLAKIFIEAKNVEKTHHAIVRAQDIISELNITLNMDYDISKNLRSLYEFMNARLMDANIKKESSILDEVLEIAEDMRDTWKEAMGLSIK